MELFATLLHFPLKLESYYNVEVAVSPEVWLSATHQFSLKTLLSVNIDELEFHFKDFVSYIKTY